MKIPSRSGETTTSARSSAFPVYLTLLLGFQRSDFPVLSKLWLKCFLWSPRFEILAIQPPGNLNWCNSDNIYAQWKHTCSQMLIWLNQEILPSRFPLITAIFLSIFLKVWLLFVTISAIFFFLPSKSYPPSSCLSPSACILWAKTEISHYNTVLLTRLNLSRCCGVVEVVEEIPWSDFPPQDIKL